MVGWAKAEEEKGKNGNKNPPLFIETCISTVSKPQSLDLFASQPSNLFYFFKINLD